ncbi:hypothetical protein BDZ85DRAFT_266267 [Elsinoe ampelina]|uniref:Required for respiratory growth protein 9, mitochondrial n=1 Tax=Elsinoe ampelina TaxID=302913 RepID=A0A6A6G671_9PEZI|nr:hypothetical protein BDZ85DRAFT_266267 [Elsinoe ampelina]
MARLVCSARVLDSVVRQTVGVDGSCFLTALPIRTLSRTARPLSTRACLAFRQTSTTHDALKAGATWISADNHVPLVSSGGSGLHPNWTSQDVISGWPSTNFGNQKKEDLAEPSLIIDEKVLEHLLVNGLPGSEVGASNASESINASVEVEGEEEAARSDAVPETSTASAEEPNIPGSRVRSRKARKIRRLEAKLEAAKHDLSNTAGLGRGSTNDASSSTARRKHPASIIDDELSQVNSVLEGDHDQTPKRAKKAKPRQTMDKPSAARHIKSSRATTVPKAKPNSENEQESWRTQKAALEKKFGDQGWQPRKRISPDAIAGVRSLNASDPVTYSTDRLADYFQISPEAVRRILRSKWQPNEKQAEKRKARWERRGERKWTEMVDQGVRPPKKWRDMGIGRAAKGELPGWKKRDAGGRRQKGERWIENRSPEELFARAAEHSADMNGQRLNLPDRIL